MSQPTERLRTKMLKRLVEGTAPLLPNWLEIFESILEEICKHVFPNQSGVRQAVQNLTYIRKKYKRDCFAKVLSLVGKTCFSTYDCEVLVCFAEAYCNGKEILLERTLGFFAAHSKMFYQTDFPTLFHGIEKYGEAEIEAGIALAKKPGEIAEPPVLQKFWDPDSVWRNRKQDYGLVTAALGFTKVKELHDNLTAEGLADRVVLYLIEDTVPNRYDRQTQQEKENLIFRTIDLVKSVGLPPSDFAMCTFNALRYRRGTVREIQLILEYASEYRAEPWFLSHIFDQALEYHRMPTKRYIVIEAFRRRDPNLMTFERMAGFGMGIAYQLGDEADKQEIRRLWMVELNMDVIPATLEVVSRRFDREGFSMMQQLAISCLARNQFITPDLLAGKREWRQVRKSVSAAFGSEVACMYLNRVKVQLRADYALAMLRCGDPEKLERFLCSMPKCLWIIALHLVNKYDFHRVEEIFKTRKSAISFELLFARVASCDRHESCSLTELSGWEY